MRSCIESLISKEVQNDTQSVIQIRNWNWFFYQTMIIIDFVQAKFLRELQKISIWTNGIPNGFHPLRAIRLDCQNTAIINITHHTTNFVYFVIRYLVSNSFFCVLNSILTKNEFGIYQEKMVYCMSFYGFWLGAFWSQQTRSAANKFLVLCPSSHKMYSFCATKIETVDTKAPDENLLPRNGYTRTKCL